MAAAHLPVDTRRIDAFLFISFPFVSLIPAAATVRVDRGVSTIENRSFLTSIEGELFVAIRQLLFYDTIFYLLN